MEVEDTLPADEESLAAACRPTEVASTAQDEATALTAADSKEGKSLPTAATFIEPEENQASPSAKGKTSPDAAAAGKEFADLFDEALAEDDAFDNFMVGELASDLPASATLPVAVDPPTGQVPVPTAAQTAATVQPSDDREAENVNEEAENEEGDDDDDEEEMGIEDELEMLFGEVDAAEEQSAAAAAEGNADVAEDQQQRQNAGAEDASSVNQRPQAAADGETRENPFADDHKSRYMRDDEGNVWLKWKADYATRGGGGRAQCRDMQCLERHQQMGIKVIEKGALRIGRRILMPGKEGEARNMTIMWYHARCIFNAFTRSRKTTRCIEAKEDIEGFENLHVEDQRMLEQIISGSVDLRNASFGEGGGAQATRSPGKRQAGEGVGQTPENPAKRGRFDTVPKDRTLNLGQRVWTHCKVRADESEAARPDGMVSVKSKKAELGMVRDIDLVAGLVLVQFESRDHEQERMDKLSMRKFQKIRAWLSYPRTFEGKKQKVPLSWIDWKRNPPRLCSCTRQEWGHDCQFGTTCSRGVSTKVWGVAQ
mmetsp:Transcript_51789/g.123243  ORF Transcript_51789/g.123243 Transcript_51789/m.123243 type:complete len:541 (+) Transcript_51789:38-1660(+)